MKSKFLALLMILAFAVSTSFAADVYNVGTIYTNNPEAIPSTGNIVAAFEDFNHVTYVYRFTFVDSSNAYHSKPIYIGGCNVDDAYRWAKQSAVGDANVILHFSADNRTNWETTTPAGLDAVSSTAKTDTVGVQGGVDDGNFHYARWMVIEAVGGSGTNADGDIMTIVVKMRKNDPGLLPNGKPYLVAKVARKSSTNP